MRRRLIQKKRTVLLCTLPFLVVGGMTLFRMLAAEREVFLQKVHLFVEQKLSETTGLEVSLGTVRFLTFHDFFVEDLALRLPDGTGSLVLPRAHLHQSKESLKLSFKNGEFFWKGFHLTNLKGEGLLGGAPLGEGPVALLKKVKVEGTFSEKGKVRFSMTRKNLLTFEGNLHIADFRWGERRVSGFGKFFFFIRERKDPWRNGKIKMAWRGLYLQERPLENLFGRFSFTEENFFVERLRWGEALTLSGRTKRLFPHETAARLRFVRLHRKQMEHFVQNPSEKKIPRLIEGELFFRGPLRKAHVSGHLVAHEGRMKDIDYERFHSTFRGQWPVVTIESRIERIFPEESSMTILGLVDLGELGKKGFYKTLSLEEADAVVWKGISLQIPSREAVVFGKGNQKSSVSLKTFLNQEPLREEAEEFELEYKLRETKRFKMRFKGEEEFLGVEHKLDF